MIIECLDRFELGTRIISREGRSKKEEIILKRCPFCGEQLSFPKTGTPYMHCIYCNTCEAITGYYHSKFNALRYGILKKWK